MNYETEQAEFIKAIKGLSGSYSTYQIFSDFCEMAAISLYQPFAKNEDLEKKYLSIIGKYKKKEVDVFPKLLACVINGLSARFGDFLGECYMQLEISNKHQGQFFTPYHVSSLMSQLLGTDTILDENGKEGLSEPCVGSGGMVIARAEALKNSNINYQAVMEVQAVDTDKMCFHMCYIHLTLLHISAEVIWGNSLSLEVFETWYTPSNIMNGGYRGGFTRPTPKVEDVKEEMLFKNMPVSKGIHVQGTLF